MGCNISGSTVMDSCYNLTSLTDSVVVTDVVGFANQASGGWLLLGFLIGFFVVVFLGTFRFGVEKSFIASSFSSFLVSLLFWYSFGIDVMIPTLFLVVLGFAMLFSYVRNR